jgi:hypothetical protein
VAIYPVDVRGLVSGMEASINDLPSRQPVSLTDNADVHVSAVTDTQETMREVALEAGGNQNEIKNSVALAVGDAGASYTLGYYPQDHRWNGKYRSIKVKVDRGRVVARYRRGYFAIDPKQVKDRDSDRQVAATLAMVTPATLVAFSARVKSPAEDESKLGIDLLVDANTLSMEDTKPQSVQGQVWPITYKGLLSRKDGNPENCQNAFLRLFCHYPSEPTPAVRAACGVL